MGPYTCNEKPEDSYPSLCASFFLLGATYILVAVLSDQVLVSRGFGLPEEHKVPYNNIHLNEEIAEGGYTPFRDPIFCAYTVANGVFVFLVGGFFQQKVLRHVGIFLPYWRFSDFNLSSMG